MANNIRQTPNEQAPEIRAKNFAEVSSGFDETKMLAEASRCLGCKNAPCMKGCPVGVNIPDFITRLKQNDPIGACEIIKKKNSLPAICGRVCPQETQCEQQCVWAKKGIPVAIGLLERYSADYTLKNGKPQKTEIIKNGRKVAIIGSGPSGLSCAGELALNGYEVTVYEAFHKTGGVLVYGIPEFRLPKDVVQAEIDKLADLGVRFETNVVIGKTLLLDELREEFDYIFIGTGAGLPYFMGIKGESLSGVYSANEYLTRVNLMKAFREDSTTPILRAKKVAVVGAGNVAADSARTALRMGAEEVSMVYRRSRKEMPARAEELHHAEQEGIKFVMLTNPVEILGDTKVEGMKCVRMELGEPDASGRRSPIVIPDSEFTVECDMVIMALGTSPNPILKNSTPDLKTDRRGRIVVIEETNETSIQNVYAGGDAVTGAATVILAMEAGKKAAQSIINKA